MTTYTSLLLKTLQATSFVTGDDGDLEKGVARSYTTLDADQYSGTTSITMAGKTETHTNNCVQDNVTGLMWSRSPTTSVDWQLYQYNGAMMWTADGAGAGVFEYLAAANTAILAGHSDWRVPNIFELISIMDLETGVNSAFDNITGIGLWSSTTYMSSTIYAYLISNYDIATQIKDSSYNNLILVRGTPTARGNSLIHGMVD